jgi:hypothetical protein
MAERYKNAVQFFVIYIREAHPSDGRQAPQNVRERIVLPNARTQEQKEEHAEMCVTKLDIRFPTLVDKLDNKVEQAYAGWPDRLYLIGKDGRVLYKSGPGPRGFIPSELENAIRKTLAQK